MAKPIFSFRDVEINSTVRVLSFEIPGGVTTPSEFAVSVEEIAGQLVGDFGLVIDGRGPVWGYTMVVHAAHPTRWVGTRDPRLGVVVVQSHVPGVKMGDVLEFPE